MWRYLPLAIPRINLCVCSSDHIRHIITIFLLLKVPFLDLHFLINYPSSTIIPFPERSICLRSLCQTVSAIGRNILILTSRSTTQVLSEISSPRLVCLSPLLNSLSFLPFINLKLIPPHFCQPYYVYASSSVDSISTRHRAVEIVIPYSRLSSPKWLKNHNQECVFLLRLKFPFLN